MNNVSFYSFHSDDAFCALLPQVKANMLRLFGHPVATCSDMLGIVGSNFTILKREPTTCIMLRPTVLRYVALTCCDRLAGT